MRPTPGTYALGFLLLVTLTSVFAISFFPAAGRAVSVVGLAAALAVILSGGAIALRTSGPMGRPRVRDAVVAALAALATLYLARVLGLTVLVAAALVATALGVAMLEDGPLDARAGTAGYTGGFVGLMSPNVTIGWYWVVLAGLVSGVLWSLIASSALVGAGGRMGTTAFMASASIYHVADLLGDRGNALLVPPVEGLAHWSVVPVGCTATLVAWLLMNRLGWSLPMASGLTSLAVCGGLAIWGPPTLKVVLAAAWYGGTAVGATAVARLPNAAWVAVAGLAYSALMLRFRGPLDGHVGVIGATGLMGVLGAIAIREVLQRAATRLPGQPRVA